MKKIIIGIVIGLVAFPTITLGGTFVSSLIQGKTAEEAVQILAEQIDSLMGRVGALETKQLEQERLSACNFADTALTTAQMQGGIINYEIKNFDDLIIRIIKERDKPVGGDGKDAGVEGGYQMWQSRLEIVQSLKERYLVAKAKCEEIVNVVE